jgi:hypothetical protein
LTGGRKWRCLSIMPRWQHRHTRISCGASGQTAQLANATLPDHFYFRAPGVALFPSSFSLADEGHGAPGRRRAPRRRRPDGLARSAFAPVARRRMPLTLQRGRRRPALHSDAFCSASRKLIAPAFAPKLERESSQPGRCARPAVSPEPAVTSRGRRTPDPAPSLGSPREHGPSSSETARL